MESHDKVEHILRENNAVKSSATLWASNSSSFNNETIEKKGIQDSCQELNVSNGMTKMASAQQKMLRYKKEVRCLLMLKEKLFQYLQQIDFYNFLED